MTNKIGLVTTTVSNIEQAENLSSLLLAQRLIACAQFTQTHSIYRWQGKIQSEEEIIIKIKYDLNSHQRLLDEISANHPYDIPEIIIEQVLTTEKYFQWCQKECQSS